MDVVVGDRSSDLDFVTKMKSRWTKKDEMNSIHQQNENHKYPFSLWNPKKMAVSLSFETNYELNFCECKECFDIFPF